MIDSGDIGMGPDNIQAVLMGLPVVDDNGQTQFLCQLQLLVQYLLLMGTGGILLPIIVQPYLSNRLDFGVGR